MKCTTVRPKLAGYLDDAITGTTSVAERVQIGEHLHGCTVCRAELERFRKLSVLLSRMPKNVPPGDLAVRIKVAAAQT
jgi:predicted anti-sigma-YlaC factor YlaD